MEENSNNTKNDGKKSHLGAIIIVIIIILLIGLLSTCKSTSSSSSNSDYTYCWYCQKVIAYEGRATHCTYESPGLYTCDYCGKTNAIS